ncbi:MAG TPA: TIGR01841 family phasin [Noviherbaspirillum sp.]|uniref:TIGR01841 family phasin n=1 Tax=Noviherbaspirillum sp. TaxID=1926288 RepID=UPI002B46F2DA|nr:TIGR01841 family phasin [Noviherbaspirillum sp.]HJV86389.1 TIGR01841 family phasin [Noviherbaspirillum sp.]
MLIPTQDQISAATRAQLQAQLDLWSKLNGKALEGFMKLADLNMAAIRQNLASSSEAAHRLLSPAKPGTPFWTVAAGSRPEIGDALNYSREAAHIALGVSADIARLVEQQIDEASHETIKLFGDIANAIPAGSSMEFMKSAIGSAASRYGQWVKTTEQAADAMRNGLFAGTEAAIHPAAKAPKRAKQASHGRAAH